MTQPRTEVSLISLVIPVFNEQDSLRQLHQEISTVGQTLPVELEIVFVDDGSKDGSWATIRGIQQEDSRVSAIRFRRNFGKAAALSAGFEAVRGDLVFSLDADLQDNPKEIPRFLEKMSEGFDLVSGWKKIRHDPWHKTLPSKVFNWLVSTLTGVHLHDHNCGFKCYRREVVEEIQLYGEFHRFTPVLADSRGFRVGELVVDHRPRQHGKSKYGWQRFIRGLLDLLTVKFLTSYSHRPQHLLGSLGLAFIGGGILGLSYLAVLWFATNYMGADFEPLHRRPLLLLSATALLLGFHMLSIGLIAEMITAANHEPNEAYSISERRLSRPAAKAESVAGEESSHQGASAR